MTTENNKNNNDNMFSRRPWTIEEDKELMRLVLEHGRKWSIIWHNFQNRSQKELRQRYLTMLDPNLVQYAFTKEEDNFILKKVSQIGKNWALIADMLEKRTPKSVAKRYQILVNKAKQTEEEFIPLDTSDYTIPKQIFDPSTLKSPFSQFDRELLNDNLKLLIEVNEAMYPRITLKVEENK